MNAVTAVIDTTPTWVWMLAVIGAAAAVVGGVSAWQAARRTRRIETLVAHRTAELAQINEKLAEEICDHLSTEHALDKERESLKAVLDNLHEGILVLDAGGELRMLNGAALRIYTRLAGVEFVDEEALSPLDFYGSADHDALSWPHARALRGESVRDCELTLRFGNRAPAILSVSAQPLSGGDGRQRGAVIVIRDITERKEVERLKAEFVATVSHELRTPITSIRGSLGLIAAGVSGDKTKQLVDIALRNSDRLAHLINDLLDIEKIESGKMRLDIARHSLVDLIEQALESNVGYAQNFNVTYTFQPPPFAAIVQVDAHRMLQVLANLLSNAVKFSPCGATVDVALSRFAGQVRVSVRDRGPGIPLQFHDRLFQKFSQADSSDARAKSGTGLGLAICKALIEQMGGRIGFDTAVGVGTTFYFELPVEDELRDSRFEIRDSSDSESNIAASG